MSTMPRTGDSVVARESEREETSSRELRLGGSARISVHGPCETSVAPELILQRDTRCLSSSLVASIACRRTTRIDLFLGKKDYDAQTTS